MADTETEPRKQHPEALQQASAVGTMSDWVDLSQQLLGFGIFDHDHVGERLYWSPELRRLHGWPAERPTVLPELLQLIFPDDREDFIAAMARAHDPRGEGWFNQEYRIVQPNGEVRWLLSRSRTFFAGEGEGRHPVRTLGVVQDISERKRAEEAFRQRAEELETLMEMAPVAIWVSRDPACAAMTGNAMANAFYEARVGENLSAGPIDGPQDTQRRFYRDGRELRPNELPMQQAVIQNREVPDGQLDVLLPSGRWISMGGAASPLRDAEGNIRGAVAAFQNITDRVRAEQALRESEQRFRLMADGLPLLVWVNGVHGDQEFVNRTYYEFFGIRPEELRPVTWKSLILPEDRGAFISAFERCLEARSDFHAECRARHADGRIRWLESWARPRITEQGEFLGFIGASSDITERKEAEAELERVMQTLEDQVRDRTAVAEHRASQLQSLTLQLTQAEEQERRRLAQVLHDGLQQTLTGARFCAHLLKKKGADQPELADTLRRLEEALDESIVTARSLSHELSPSVLYDRGLCAALSWLAQVMQARHGLLVQVEATEEAPELSEAVRGILFQAVREVLFNVSKHAGTSEARIRLATARGELVVCVEDEGRGFDPTVLDRGDTPGLGLFAVRERLAICDGRMQIDSAPGEGTRVRLSVPLREPTEAPDR